MISPIVFIDNENILLHIPMTAERAGVEFYRWTVILTTLRSIAPNLYL
jgi:hypothetical protein